MTTAEYAENLEKTLLEALKTLESLDADHGFVIWNNVEQDHWEATSAIRRMLATLNVEVD